MIRPSNLAALALASVLAIPAAAWQGGGRPQRQQGTPQGMNRPSGGAQRLQGPGPHAGDWLRNNMNLPPAEQEKKLESDDAFRKLPPQQQDRLRNRLQKFNNLPTDQKQRWLTRMEWYEHLNPDQRQRAKDLHMQMQSLDPDRRKAIRKTLNSMRDMSPDQRQKAIESDGVKNSFNDQERQIMKGMADIAPPAGDDDGIAP